MEKYNMEIENNDEYNNQNQESLIEEIENSYKNVGFFRRVFSWRDILDNIIQKIRQSKTTSPDMLKFEDQKNQLKKLEEEKQFLHKENIILEEKLSAMKEDISDKTSKLLSIFEKSPGTQGKIGELRLEVLLDEYFDGEGKELWTKNLKIGNEVVEFAIRKTHDSDKWIPIDSKVLLPTVDPDKTIIVDNSYISRLNTQVNKVKKYIGKKNTEDFALLVLQEDWLYKKINDEFPEKIKEWNDQKVFISSPSMFIQFTNTISYLAHLITISKNTEKIKKNILLIENHISKFYKATKDSVEKLTAAFDIHLKNIESNIKKLDKLDDGKEE